MTNSNRSTRPFLLAGTAAGVGGRKCALRRRNRRKLDRVRHEFELYSFGQQRHRRIVHFRFLVDRGRRNRQCVGKLFGGRGQ